MRERVRQLENRGCVKWFGGERKSRLPPSPLSSVEVFPRVFTRKCNMMEQKARRICFCETFFFPCFWAKSCVLHQGRDTATTDRPGSMDCYLCIASPGCCLANQQNLLTCTLLPLKAAMMTILPL